MAGAIIACIAIIGQSVKRASAIKGVANMAIQILLRLSFILYSHNKILCPPSEQIVRFM